jgi:hypothetical protein
MYFRQQTSHPYEIILTRHDMGKVKYNIALRAAVDADRKGTFIQF